MSHIPFGYKIEDGAAVICDEDAEKVKKLFKNYLLGLSLSQAAKESGLNIYHGSAGRMLKNKRYLGDNFYPSIIDRDIFTQAEMERKKRTEKLGRIFAAKETGMNGIKTKFYMGQITEEYTDPLLQAEYLYSLIKVEEVEDGSE